MIRVLIKRTLPKGLTADQQGVLLEKITLLRSRAASQPGYISGETMMNVENPDEYLVISTWESQNDWQAWFATPERAGIQKEIDALLGQETEYKFYYYPDKRRIQSGMAKVSPI